MVTQRGKFVMWAVLLSLFFISAGSIEQAAFARTDNQLCTQSPDIAYIFDLNGVLFDTNKSTVFRQLGIKDTLSYVARNGSAAIKKKFYGTLDLVNGTIGNSLNVSDPDGDQMPELMVKWLQGTLSCNTIGARIIKAIGQHPEWFSGTTEQRLMARMTYAIFKPEKFVASRCVIRDLIPLIKQLKENGAKLYVLSNWDSESFALLKEKYPEVFDLFDDVIISGQCNMIKPQPEIFAFTREKIAASCICFLDDQQENIDAARDAGIYTIKVTRKNGFLKSGIDVDAVTKQAIALLCSRCCPAN